MRYGFARVAVPSFLTLGLATEGFSQALTAAQASPSNQQIRLDTVVTLSGLTPIDAAWLPGNGNLFVGTSAPSTAQVAIVNPVTRTVSGTPFLSFAGTGVPITGQGLQGITFSPNYNDNTKPGYHKFYTYEAETGFGTATLSAQNVMYRHPEVTTPGIVGTVREWTANAAGTAVDTSVASRIVFNFGTPAGHMGGGMKFGPDGFLYLSTGDGGGNGDGGSTTSSSDGFTGNSTSGAPGISNGQDFSNVLGKVVRIDPYTTNANGTARATPAGSTARTLNGVTKYFIPNSNPFVGNPQNIFVYANGTSAAPVAPAPELWAMGFRNPWKLSFDRNAVPGDTPFVADVGSRLREEINKVAGGTNNGWPYREGDVRATPGANNRPLVAGQLPYFKQTSPGVYAPYDLNPALSDPTQMTGPIARLGTRSGSGNPLHFADTPTNDINGGDTNGDGVYGDPDGIYGNAYGDTAAVTGGFVYRGTQIPDLAGMYVFGGYEYLVDDPAQLPSAYGATSGGGRMFYFDPNEVATYKTIRQFNFDAGTGIPTQSTGDLLGVVQADNGELFGLFGGGDVRQILPSALAGSWRSAATGTWSDGANWTKGRPNATDAVATFGPTVSGATAVTLDADKTVGQVIFNSPNSYQLGGTGTLTLDVSAGSASVNINAGSHNIACPVNLFDDVTLITALTTTLALSGAITTNGRLIAKAGSGTLSVVGFSSTAGLDVQAGTFSASGTVRVVSLTIAGTPVAPTSTYDVSGGTLIVNYTGTIGSLLADTSAQIRAARGGRNPQTHRYLYDGKGITSSLASTNNTNAGFDKFAVGIINNADLTTFGLTAYSTFGGFAQIDATSILIRYTYYGDANLDGIINTADYDLINRGFAGTIANVGWLSGDFNLDGVINTDDFAIIDFGYLTQTGVLGFPDPVAVPEPVMAGVALLSASLLSQRPRKRRGPASN